jgi:hypothetical protein
MTRCERPDKPGSIEQCEIDRVAQLTIAEIARMQAITAIVDRQHLDWVLGVAKGEIEIRNTVERAALAERVVDGGSMLFARRVPGADLIGLVAERGQGRADQLDAAVCARTAICFSPAIICAAVTSSSGLAQRLRRSLVPSITIAWVTPGCASTSRSKRRKPLGPRDLARPSEKRYNPLATAGVPNHKGAKL